MQYRFYIDAVGHLDDAAIGEALRALHRDVERVVFLGSWPVDGASGTRRPTTARARPGSPRCGAVSLARHPDGEAVLGPSRRDHLQCDEAPRHGDAGAALTDFGVRQAARFALERRVEAVQPRY